MRIIHMIGKNIGGRLYEYVQTITSFLSPPVCATFVQAVLFKRINEKGAFWGLVMGLIVGFVRFIVQFVYTVPPCIYSYLDQRPAFISKFHFLHFGFALFVFTCAVAWVVSLLTDPIPDKYVNRYS